MWPLNASEGSRTGNAPKKPGDSPDFALAFRARGAILIY